MKKLRILILRFIRSLKRYKYKVPPTFDEELDRQCNRIILPAGIIILIAWLFYIPIDLELHPDVPLIIVLRIGLSIVGIIAIALHLLPLKIKGRYLLFLIGAYLVIAAGIITGLTKANPAYLGGYLFVIMTLIIGPLKKRHTWSVLLISLISFFVIGILQGMKIDDFHTAYGIRDLAFTSLTAAVFIYILDRIRYRTFLQSKALDEERSKLKLRNSLIEKELNMARAIQQRLIPSRSPNNKIATLYKPMDMVGGDFYDFIYFRNSKKIGIFVSDVSGHGIPAAFITSMVKSMILQAGELRSDPAGLMMYLNDFLSNQTENNFISAFYGIYDPENHDFIYCNAGHNLPFIIDNGNISNLKCPHRSIPLSVLDNETMNKVGKAYQNSSIRLKSPTKLILYTDGLVETISLHSQNSIADFEKQVIKSAFKRLYKLSCNDFVNELFEELVKFRGSASFDDDVCLICMDI
jgi:serine phosphatase RsbU (regulator of sigma subunit)